MNPTGIEAQVCADIAARQARGIAKYGTTVADNPLTLNEWLQHAYEEALDMAVYLKRAMAGHMNTDYRSPGTRVTLVGAGIELEDGDKRLLDLVATALGSNHPAVDDVVSLLLRARKPAAPTVEQGESDLRHDIIEAIRLTIDELGEKFVDAFDLQDPDALGSLADSAIDVLRKRNKGTAAYNFGPTVASTREAAEPERASECGLTECHGKPMCPRCEHWKVRDDGMPGDPDERRLRRLLAVRVAMQGAYYDDGEAQGQEHGINIDFMRDPVAVIDSKLRELNLARGKALAAAEPDRELVNDQLCGLLQHGHAAGEDHEDISAFLRGTGLPVATVILMHEALATFHLRKGLTFERFRRANVTRCLKWHPEGIESWSPSDWMTAIVGELGELAGLIKMRNRERDGLPGNKFSPTDDQIASEAADVMTYLDLFCAAHKIDLGRAVVAKFNEVSERVGFPDRIEVQS